MNTTTEQRLAEIYSYFIDECYDDDYSGTFSEWLSTSMYGEELTQLCEGLFNVALEDIQPASLEEVEVIEAEYQATRFDEDAQ